MAHGTVVEKTPPSLVEEVCGRLVKALGQEAAVATDIAGLGSSAEVGELAECDFTGGDAGHAMDS